MSYSATDFNRAAINQLKALTTHRKNVDEQINELIRRREGLARQEMALKRFLVTAGALPDEDVKDASDNVSDETEGTRNRSDAEIANQIYDILDELNGEEMHYRQIPEKLVANRWRFPTNNKASRDVWVNRVLNEDPRFVRPSRRGYYALKKHHPNVTRSVGERQRISR